MPDSYVQPKAAWRVTLDGRDLTSVLEPRLMSLKLSEKRGEAADELEITITDVDGQVAIPKEGARLSVALGWERGTGVTLGLVNKGSFKVDEVSWSGPPDLITITARSADMAGRFRTRKSKVWTDTTLGEIVDTIAAENDLQPRCHPDLADKEVTAAEQHNKSDMQFLRDLGRRYDAIASVKGGCLLFSPINAKKTATGKDVPTVHFDRRDRMLGIRVSWRRSARENGQDGAEAQWHDQSAAKRQKAGSGGSNKRRLKRVYASENDANAAADSESKRLKRAAASLDLELAYGEAIAAPGVRVTVSGFKAEIDAQKWLTSEVEHTMDGRGGFRTSVKLDAST